MFFAKDMNGVETYFFLTYIVITSSSMYYIIVYLTLVPYSPILERNVERDVEAVALSFLSSLGVSNIFKGPFEGQTRLRALIIYQGQNRHFGKKKKVPKWFPIKIKVMLGEKECLGKAKNVFSRTEEMSICLFLFLTAIA